MLKRMKAEWAAMQGCPFRLSDKDKALACFAGAVLTVVALLTAVTGN